MQINICAGEVYFSENIIFENYFSILECNEGIILVMMMPLKVASRWITTVPDGDNVEVEADDDGDEDHDDDDDHEDDAAQGGEQVDDSCSNPPQGVHGSWSPSSWGNNYLINKLIANGANIDLFPEFNGELW